ncbi:MAG: hypothetical protein IJ636_03090 [Bacteroidales bacterium]|nr:hypothetical protein [Bacteroidales bacterium]
MPKKDKGMDAVITFVDGSDPLWQQDYRTVVPQPALDRRYRDWGTLPFLLRGIERHLPFIDRVFLVVARESQVPRWADTSQLKVVYHADFLPRGCLPTFNSAAIELFLHRIPGLAEQYLYFNDDLFPLKDVAPEDFFPGGKPATGYSRHLFAGNLYKRHCRNSDRLARAALGRRPGLCFLRPQHAVSPMLRSVCETLYRQMEAQIIASATPLRDAGNCNQYLYLDYQLLSGRGVARRSSNRHVSLAAVSPQQLAAAILDPKDQFLCINDVEMPQSRYLALREAIHAAFAVRFPDKSRFER